MVWKLWIGLLGAWPCTIWAEGAGPPGPGPAARAEEVAARPGKWGLGIKGGMAGCRISYSAFHMTGNNYLLVEDTSGSLAGGISLRWRARTHWALRLGWDIYEPLTIYDSSYEVTTQSSFTLSSAALGLSYIHPLPAPWSHLEPWLEAFISRDQLWGSYARYSHPLAGMEARDNYAGSTTGLGILLGLDWYRSPRFSWETRVGWRFSRIDNPQVSEGARSGIPLNGPDRLDLDFSGHILTFGGTYWF